MPERTCIACRQKRTKNALLRFTIKDRILAFDPTHKEPGRGAYVCQENSCLTQAIAKHAFNKAFKKNKIFILPEIIEQAQCHIKKNY